MTNGLHAKIVFTDVDGTLVNNEHHPIPESAPIISRVARSMPFCLVSARPPEGLYPIQKQLGFTGPLACFSGAYVLDHEGDELFSTVIPIDDALQIKQFLEEELPRVVVGTYGFHNWIVDDRSDPRVQREEGYVQYQSCESRDLAGVFGSRGVHKFLLMGEPDAIRAAQRTVEQAFPQLTAVRSNATLCEIMNREASKSRAVRLLCQRYQTTARHAIAFGDGMNDLDMLQAVGQSFAMANAEAEVKQAATQTLPWSNEECGVARMLQQLTAGAQGN